MAKTIGLNITLNGVQTAVTSIKELETELTKAREKLGSLEIGTTEFKNLSGEIQRADSQLKNLKKSAEGLESTQQAEAFAKVAAGITTSFAAAQAAIQLFGAESEEVTEAIIKAQQVLTIAVAARGAAEAALNIRIVANIVAQKAQTLATTATTAATRALWTTIAANPIGALITVLGVAAAALLTFGGDTEDAADEQEEFEKKLSRTNAALDFQLALLEKSGATSVQIAEARLAAEKELEEVILAQYVQAQTRNRFSEETEELRLKATEQERKVQLANLDVINAKKKQVEEEDKKRADAQQKRSDAANKRLEEEKRIAVATYQASIDAIKSLRRELETEVPEPEVIKQLKETLETLKGFSKQVEQKPFNQLVEEFRTLPPQFTDAVTSVDVFGETFLRVRKELSEAAQSGDGFGEVAGRVLAEFGQLRSAGLITQEAFNALTDIVDSYKSVTEVINQENLPVGAVDEYYKKLQENLVATGKIIFKVTDDEKVVREELTVGTEEALTGFATYQEGLLQRLADWYAKDADLQKLSEEEREKLARERAQARLDILREESLEIIKQEQNIIQFRAKALELQAEREKSQSLATIGFFKQNADAFIAEYEKLFGDDIEAINDAFQNNLQNELGFTTELTAEELEAQQKLYEEFYKKLKEKREADRADEDKDRQERKATFDAYISGISSSASQLAGVFRNFAQQNLDALEIQNQEVLDSIVGTTEEANQKRLEQEQIFNEQKKEIEKKAALTELRLTLLQAIADGAAAVIATAAKTPALIPVVTAINLAQIGLIQSQIQTTRSLQRGGLLAGGGLLQGPSHEQGGIRLAQAGVVAEGGEAVINRVGSVVYRDLLDSINQNSGGAPLVVSSFDDTRILEALAKQRKEPIRAYVQEQEITNKQAISRRLEQLSSL